MLVLILIPPPLFRNPDYATDYSTSRNCGFTTLSHDRLFVVVMVGVAIAWVPVVKETQGGQVFIYIQEVSLYLSPPVACIYILAVTWPRCNEQVI